MDADDTLEMKVQFDPDFDPYNDHNRRAAQAHGLRFDPKKDHYVDDEGCLVRDRFGQSL